jgi:predicted RNA-binding protein (virulence factor B family)
MFIQLANFINSKAEEFTFFTEYKIGRAIVTATLVSKGQEYKLGDSNKDFVFEDIETHLPMATISTAI